MKNVSDHYSRISDPEELRTCARDHLRRGEFVPGLIALDRLIELDKATSVDWNDTGQALATIGEFFQAIGAFKKCLELDPGNNVARHDLGRAYYKLGDADRGVALLGQVADETDLLNVRMGLATIAPCAPSASHQDVLRYRREFAAAVRRNESPLLASAATEDARNGRLRVGYVSAHFGGTNYMKPVWPLINAHSDQFEIVLFDDADSVPAGFDWLHRRAEIECVTSQTNRELAETIRSKGIDIIVDLSAYSKPERLGVYVHRAAPIQMAWFNMYATSGFEEIDYIIGDGAVVRTAEEPWYCETVKRLPVSYLTFQTNHDAPEVTPLPGASRREFVFGCLSTQYKITPLVMSAWVRILRDAKDSVLLLANRELKSPHNREFVLEQFDRRAIDRSRIRFLPPADHFNFLKYYDQIDLALDTFPYSGGTTAMEALWQGVPVVTFDGDRWASRTCTSLLRHSHLPQFVGTTVDDYCQIAVHYAVNDDARRQLSTIRNSLRDELNKSAVCDSAKLARGMEQVFQQAMQR